MIKLPEYSPTELFLALATEPFGTQVAIHGDGRITIHDASLILTDEDVVAILKAEGDFDRSGWGIERYSGDDETLDGFVVNGLDGVFDSDNKALEAAVAEFGLRAEDIDELERRVMKAMEENIVL